MKKFFTSLLALVGMAVGLTLTSCGGGGGSNDNGPNLVGLDVKLAGNSPYFQMYISERFGRTNNYACRLIVSSSSTDGTLSLSPGYPRTTDNGQTVEIKGQLGFNSSDWVASDNAAASLFGIPTHQGDGCVLQELFVTLNVREDGSGALQFEGKGYGFDNQGNPDLPSEEEQAALGVDGPYYPINKTYSGGLSVEGPLRRLFDN